MLVFCGRIFRGACGERGLSFAFRPRAREKSQGGAYSIRSDSRRYIRGVFLFDSNNACAGVYADLFFARRRGIRENFT